MKMKKFISGVLAAGLAVSMSLTAFAAETTTNTDADVSTVSITKTFKLDTSSESEILSPAASFTVESTGSKNVLSETAEVPALGTITAASFAEGAATDKGATGSISVALPAYSSAGVYEYTLKEVNSSPLAGVVYDTDAYILRVTVRNDGKGGFIRTATLRNSGTGDKVDGITNTYKADNLLITKTVTGGLGDKTYYFTFKVTLTPQEGVTTPTSFKVSGGSSSENPNTIAPGVETTFKIRDGETITIHNLPAGMTYYVEEVKTGDYENKYSTKVDTQAGTTYSTGLTGEIETTVVFENIYDGGDPETGVSLDSLPYILILAIAGAGLIIFIVAKKRSRRED